MTFSSSETASSLDFLIISTTGPSVPSEITFRSPGFNSWGVFAPSGVSSDFLSPSACFFSVYCLLPSIQASAILDVINLMEPTELNRAGKPFVPYENQMTAIARAMNCATRFDRRPIRDYGIPTRQDMVGILDLVDQSITRAKPVYVHCLGGLGRTGTVVGCYLARHGYAAGVSVLETIRVLRKNTATGTLSSPETDQQIKLVCSWRPGE